MDDISKHQWPLQGVKSVSPADAYAAGYHAGSDWPVPDHVMQAIQDNPSLSVTSEFNRGFEAGEDRRPKGVPAWCIV